MVRQIDAAKRSKLDLFLLNYVVLGMANPSQLVAIK